MSLLLDVITLAILALCVYSAYKRGFLRTLVDMVGKIVALVCAYIFASPFANYISARLILPAMRKGLVATLQKDLGATASSVDINRLFADTPQFFKDILSGFGMSFDKLVEKLPSSGESGVYSLDDIATAIVSPMAKAVSFLIAFVLLFTVFMLIVYIVSKVAGLLNDIPILKGLNRTAGLFLGLLNGILLVFIISYACQFIIPLLEKQDSGDIISSTDKTLVYHFFDDLNPLKAILPAPGQNKT